jgi:ATP-dependent helicase YprA (DUF1998 family)
LDVFDLRERLVDDYADYTRSFVVIRDERIAEHVDRELEEGLLWPDPIVQLNPAFEPGGTVDELVAEGWLEERCGRIFRRGKSAADPDGEPLLLHRHQREAVEVARSGANYVLTTGTGSGKSLAYIVPIVDHVLRNGSGKGIQAIVVYPMNALANSQAGELEKFLTFGPWTGGRNPVTFRRYTGQESDENRQAILASPPDILLTNYVMLELILTRPYEEKIVKAAQGLRFLVLDELHTYRGRQGADVALLGRRVREACNAPSLQFVGTSATLAGPGTIEEQRAEVARVASLLFGTAVEPANVIGETLRRSTVPTRVDDPDFVEALRRRIDEPVPEELSQFVSDPLASWIETKFGLASEPGTGRLRREAPRSITGADAAADELTEITAAPVDRCAEAIRETLMRGYRVMQDNGFPVFAFRVHQFFSRGETVYASLESEAERYLTTAEQQYVPGAREKVLFPLAFCRECGQEYYTVRTAKDQAGTTIISPRPLSDTTGDDDSDAGFLYASSDEPWPSELEAMLERLPDEWLEPHGDSERVKANYRQYVPRTLSVSTGGHLDGDGLQAFWVPAPFRFCLRCGVSHGGRQPRDFGKLMTLGAGGRSSATTILSLAAIRSLRSDVELKPDARKLLSFTDNRQDASLQAGHFNDFVEVGPIRSALFRAADAAGAEGLAHDELALTVFEALALPVDLYAVDPTVRFNARTEVDRALRDVLGYRLYRDLERGWRITAPNLEQCGLLEIEYLSLDELCAADDVWGTRHQVLVNASSADRQKIASVLLDLMRRELAIRVDYLSDTWQEALKQRSSQYLVDPWAIDEEEELVHASVLYPKPRRRAAREYRGNVYVSARGGFGQYLRRSNTFTTPVGKLSLDATEAVIRDLLEALRVAGLVVRVKEESDEDGVPGYQVAASAMRWHAGDGTRAFHDPIRIPSAPDDGGRTNPYFIDFYRGVAADGQGPEAREHTAQVPPAERQEREDEFRTGKLPILFCSPTMELNDDGWRIPDWLWAELEPLLPERPAHPLGCHNPRVPDRDAMNAILFVLRTGCQWKALNATGICSSSSAHRRFQEWDGAGSFVSCGGAVCLPTTTAKGSSGSGWRWTGR